MPKAWSFLAAPAFTLLLAIGAAKAAGTCTEDLLANAYPGRANKNLNTDATCDGNGDASSLLQTDKAVVAPGTGRSRAGVLADAARASLQPAAQSGKSGTHTAGVLVPVLIVVGVVLLLVVISSLWYCSSSRKWVRIQEPEVRRTGRTPPLRSKAPILAGDGPVSGMARASQPQVPPVPINSEPGRSSRSSTPNPLASPQQTPPPQTPPPSSSPIIDSIRDIFGGQAAVFEGQDGNVVTVGVPAMQFPPLDGPVPVEYPVTDLSGAGRRVFVVSLQQARGLHKLKENVGIPLERVTIMSSTKDQVFAFCSVQTGLDSSPCGCQIFNGLGDACGTLQEDTSAFAATGLRTFMFRPARGNVADEFGGMGSYTLRGDPSKRRLRITHGDQEMVADCEPGNSGTWKGTPFYSIKCRSKADIGIIVLMVSGIDRLVAFGNY